MGFCGSPKSFVRDWIPAFKVNTELLWLPLLGSV